MSNHFVRRPTFFVSGLLPVAYLLRSILCKTIHFKLKLVIAFIPVYFLRPVSPVFIPSPRVHLATFTVQYFSFTRYTDGGKLYISNVSSYSIVNVLSSGTSSVFPVPSSII